MPSEPRSTAAAAAAASQSLGRWPFSPGPVLCATGRVGFLPPRIWEGPFHVRIEHVLEVALVAHGFVHPSGPMLAPLAKRKL